MERDSENPLQIIGLEVRYDQENVDRYQQDMDWFEQELMRENSNVEENNTEEVVQNYAIIDENPEYDFETEENFMDYSSAFGIENTNLDPIKETSMD